MTRIHPKKLMHSKWTAVKPKNKEKHFMITAVEVDEEGLVVECVIEAVMSKNEYNIEWRELNNTECWAQGWK